MGGKRIATVLLVAIGIPVAGFLVSLWIQIDFNADLAVRGLPSYQEICAVSEVLQLTEVAAACAEFANIALLGQAMSAPRPITPII